MLSRSRQRGISLIEVMVAIVVFSVAMLGIAMLQIKGMQYTSLAGTRTVAVLQARSLAEAMRANPVGVWGVGSSTDIASRHGDLSGSYYRYDGGAQPAAGNCSGQAHAVANCDLARWLTQLKAAATSSKRGGSAAELATVKINGAAGMLTITSTWDLLSANAHGMASDESYSFDYQP